VSDFHTIPSDARPAASLLLLRDGPDGDTGDTGVEVLMLVRAERAGDQRSGIAVFPGGVLDAADRDAHAWCLGAEAIDWNTRFRVPLGALDYAVTALRETFEEVGLLRACAPDGSALDLTPGSALAAELAPWRVRLQRGEATISALCAHFDLRLDLRGLVYCAHWLTPPGSPKRWDTRFFAAPAPHGQVATPDLGEAVALMWTTPAAALDPGERGQGLKLLPVSRSLLQDLQRHGSAAAAMAAFGAMPTVPLTMPRLATHSRSGRRVVLPHELPYAEIGRLDPTGRGDVSCELLAGRAVQLSANVWRITAPNPGPMTGPGTNSYLVGAGRDWTVIDPGPADPAHLQALQDAAQAAHPEGGRIVRVLVTHTHRDHSPGTAPLAAATGAPVWGRVAAHPEWQDATFTPQHQPQHGERIPLAPGLDLRVLHTPGHASNHLCYLLEAEQLLFTGDHVMQGSTVVINPPDGDMRAYLQSLQALLDEPLQWLAPGHGFLVDQPHAVLRKLIAHRLGREGKVLDALHGSGGGSVEALLPQVYGDVNPALHGVAARSLTAHLLKLQADGRAQEQGGRWTPLGP
jgi:glyoxylase-like metal-dependent hydrolase (beta-lactamase superfamily II)/8-oxo-dGTP pyrophosphatase MutT (NUDIX family)